MIDKNLAFGTNYWKKKKMVYDMLSHHYILRKSVVFIVDTEYSSIRFQQKANKYVMDYFKKLDSKDYFGYISLGKNSCSRKFVLE